MRHVEIERMVTAIGQGVDDETVRSYLQAVYRLALTDAIIECERGAGTGPQARIALQQAAVRIARLGRP